MSNKHRAVVIEVYPNTGQCAVKFRERNRDRIECVRMNGVYTVGQTGMVDYTITNKSGLWTFTPKLTDTDRANMRVTGAWKPDHRATCRACTADTYCFACER